MSHNIKLGKYIFNHKNLAKVFRAKLLEKIFANRLKVPSDCPKEWVVDCKNVGNDDKVLIYLGRYLYKSVVQEKDILKCEKGMVTFRYIDSETKRFETRTVTGKYFLWLLMLHVLPKGFRKARCYGFLHPCSKKVIKLLQVILRFNPVKFHKKLKPRAEIICKCCGAVMKIVQTMIPATKVRNRPRSTCVAEGVPLCDIQDIVKLKLYVPDGNGWLRLKIENYHPKNRDFGLMSRILNSRKSSHLSHAANFA